MGACQPTTRGRAKGMEELRGWPDGPRVIRRRRRGWNVSFVGREREKPPPETVSYQKEIKKAGPTHHTKGGKKWNMKMSTKSAAPVPLACQPFVQTSLHKCLGE